MPSNPVELKNDLSEQERHQQQLFHAVFDPTRRGILRLLATNGQMTATAIYNNFTMSHPAVSQHLKVLREADLVRVEKSAQRHIYSLNPAQVRKLEVWVAQLTELWSRRFEKLDELLEAEKRCQNGGD